MKVKELIEELNKINPELEVYGSYVDYYGYQGNEPHAKIRFLDKNGRNIRDNAESHSIVIDNN